MFDPVFEEEPRKPLTGRDLLIYFGFLAIIGLGFGKTLGETAFIIIKIYIFGFIFLGIIYGLIYLGERRSNK